MGAIHDVLRHLVVSGPARNEAERDRLLDLVDHDDPGVKDTPTKPGEKKL